MKNINYKLFLVISIIFFVGFLVIFLAVISDYKQSNETTTLYTATVSRVDIADTGTQLFVNIYTNEFDNYFSISSNITKNISIDSIEEIKNGQKIYFRIKNTIVKDIDKVIFLPINSLSTETKNIFSLEDYNKYLQKESYPARIVCIIMAIIFLGIAILSYIKIRARNHI